MNLNEVQLIDACYVYLLKRLDNTLYEKLSDKKLVFKCNDKLYSFDTSLNKCNNYTYTSYFLNIYDVLSERNSNIDIHDIFEALEISSDELKSIQSVTNVTKLVDQIFKLLHKVDLSLLAEKYPEFKKDLIVYNLYDFNLDKTFDIYHFDNESTFELVSII